MTITLKPAQERLVQEAINAGLIESLDDLIEAAIEALPHRQTEESARQAAVRQMLAFGDKHHLTLGEPVTRRLLHEGHRV